MKYLLFILCSLLLCCRPAAKRSLNPELLQTTHLPHYPSASSLAFVDGRLYIIGDDAPYLLVLDGDHHPLDSLQLFASGTPRIPKSTKPDLESSVIIRQNDTSFLYALSSFSTPVRNHIVSLLLSGNGKMQLLKDRSAALALPPGYGVNIEGATLIGDQLVLANRANNTTRANQLLITRLDDDTIATRDLRIMPVTLPGTKKIVGISGLEYVPAMDLLLFSASTEDTPNAYTDGPVGESYLGFVSRITEKWNAGSVTADTLIALSPYLRQSRPQKIESLAVEASHNNTLILHLAADNDNGESMLYKLRWKL